MLAAPPAGAFWLSSWHGENRMSPHTNRRPRDPNWHQNWHHLKTVFLVGVMMCGKTLEFGGVFGEPSGTRTRDPLIKSQML
jgi:hypothetical protein